MLQCQAWTQLRRAHGMQVVAAWSEAIFIMLELLPGHPSLPFLKIPRGKGNQQPRRLWGQKRAKESLEGWPVE